MRECAEITANCPQVTASAVGQININTSFRSTLVVIMDAEKNVVAWATSHENGAELTKDDSDVRKAAKSVACAAMEHGIRKVRVCVKGPGRGRESAIRALMEEGLEIITIFDATPVPHNGCRPPKRKFLCN